MKIEAVTTCVDYADLLAETLPTNRHLFDRMVVVTAPEDAATQRVCEYWNVQVVLTDSFRSRWGEFCKGAGINVGLGELALDGWVLHLDADVMLPPLTRKLLELVQLDERILYGADRYIMRGAEEWRRHMAGPVLQHEADAYVHMEPYVMGPRIAASSFGGWTPIGFFQLWHPRSSGVRSYPERHNGANRTDMLFASKWPRGRRALLPELVAYHLESEEVPQGANWSGRVTRRFGVEPAPLTPPASKSRRPEHGRDGRRDDDDDPDHHHRHRKHHGDHYFFGDDDAPQDG